MRTLACGIWGLVLVLAWFLISDRGGVREYTASLRLDAPLLLWAPALGSPLLPPAPLVPDEVATLQPPCSRLGLFPSGTWAETVAERLAAADGDVQHDWHLMRAGRRGFYVVFPEMSLDVLAQRMERRRADVSRLLSFAALPEPCRAP